MTAPATTVLALSGGKDSTALALALQEREPNLRPIYFYTPTGDELPDMVAHWERLQCMLRAPLIQPPNTQTLSALIEHFRMLPSSRARWCTRIIKIQSAEAWAAELPQPVEILVGLRADEQGRIGGIYGDGVTARYPLQEWGWGLQEVLDYLRSRQIAIPRRTDCARCPYQRLGEWWDLWKSYPEIYEDAVQDEARVAAWRGKPATFRNPSRDTWPAGLAKLRERFEQGHVPRGATINESLLGHEHRVCRVCSL